MNLKLRTQTSHRVMPNYCDNWVRIRGDEQVLQMFESQPFDLEMGDPLPQEMRGPRIIYTSRVQAPSVPVESEGEVPVIPAPPVPVRRIVRRVGTQAEPLAEASTTAAPPTRVVVQRFVDSFDWVMEHWGTRWIAPLGDHYAELRLERKDGALQAFFISAWSPPIPFYNRLAEKYPSVTIEYEYAEWGVGFCGYGVGTPGGGPTHYNFGDRESIRALNDSRQWALTIWSPHFADDENGQPIDVR
jgi:hypothetical protein